MVSCSFLAEVIVPMESARQWIARLQLVPHPEGGWYREVHRSSARVSGASGERTAITTIYYLLERGQCSRWHVVTADEIWHFYAGEPLELLAYDSARRELAPLRLGTSQHDCRFVGVIPAGVWQAARPLGAYALVGCSVGPGFEFADFRFVSEIAGHATHFSGALAPYATLL